jgi:hypothetical protein
VDKCIETYLKGSYDLSFVLVCGYETPSEFLLFPPSIRTLLLLLLGLLLLLLPLLLLLGPLGAALDCPSFVFAQPWFAQPLFAFSRPQYSLPQGMWLRSPFPPVWATWQRRPKSPFATQKRENVRFNLFRWLDSSSCEPLRRPKSPFATQKKGKSTFHPLPLDGFKLL